MAFKTPDREQCIAFRIQITGHAALLEIDLLPGYISRPAMKHTPWRIEQVLLLSEARLLPDHHVHDSFTPG